MKELISQFPKKKVLVVGDLMLDKYIFGEVERISPEAPVPIVSVQKETYVPGGAANAANNISSLGGNAFLIGIVGEDSAKEILFKELTKSKIDSTNIILDKRRPTTQKIRVLGQSQQLLRIDYEEKEIADNLSDTLLNNIKNLGAIDVIIISDYAKGIINEKFMTKLKDYSSKENIPIIVDPKPRHKRFYKGVFMITPNLKESSEMVGFHIESEEEVEKAGKILMEELDTNVLITRGKDGISLFEKDKEPLHIPTQAKEVFDVSGAGDTVISTLSLAVCSGASLTQAADLANHAAGIKVGKLGTSPVYSNELIEVFD